MKFPRGVNIIFAVTCLIAAQQPLSAMAGSAIGWGNNAFGVLGDGTQYNTRYTPVGAYGMTAGVIGLGAGNAHSLWLQNSGVFSAGIDPQGQLGYPVTVVTGNNYLPLPIPGLTSGVTAIAAGSGHSFAIQNGALFGWGSNDIGQVGDGTAIDRNMPVSVVGMSAGVTAVAGGRVHSLAIKDDAVYAWGYNYKGELGDDTSTDRYLPAVVPGMAGGVKAISAGGDISLAIKNGAVYAWGNDLNGEIGNGTTTFAVYTPYGIPALSTGATAIAAGVYHCLAVKDGAVYAWGYNNRGELGDGGKTQHTTPEIVLTGHDIVAVAAAGESSFALTSKGSLWVWGKNDYGQLGLGDTVDRLLPTLLAPPAGFYYSAIDSGGSDTIAILEPVPEPASLTMLILGTAALLGGRGRRLRDSRELQGCAGS